MQENPILTPPFIELLKREFRLEWHGAHGFAHWTRVCSNGRRLALRNGANLRIIEYFSFLHDVCRRDEGCDPEHGLRAAVFAQTIRKDFIDLEDQEFSLLSDALSGHSHARQHPDLTVMSCWDADRLDLLRIGVVPDPERLCTEDARNPAMISQVCESALAWVRTQEVIL